jgi:cation diffusion facilitator family transporter
MTDDRPRVLRKVGLLLLAVNVALALVKGGAWLATGSLAVESETVNSAADSVYSLVTVAGLYLTTRPPDFEHPHGHERIEPFVGLFVALGIFAAGGTVLYQAVTSLLAGTVELSRGPTAVAVLVVAAVTKYGLYRYVLAAGDEHNSPALTATALDNRNDILTAAAAIVGVLGAAAGFPVLDPRPPSSSPSASSTPGSRSSATTSATSSGALRPRHSARRSSAAPSTTRMSKGPTT